MNNIPKTKLNVMELRPHHLLDIITEYGHDVEFKPHPYGHAVHIVAQAVLSNLEPKVKFIIGPDEICRPCKHLRSDGLCDDSLAEIDPPLSKQVYNDKLDCRLFAYLGLPLDTIMTIRQFLEIVNNEVPGIEMICTHPKEDQKSRLEGLLRGLTKLGIRGR